jgi:hypothetical protein
MGHFINADPHIQQEKWDRSLDIWNWLCSSRIIFTI